MVINNPIHRIFGHFGARPFITNIIMIMITECYKFCHYINIRSSLNSTTRNFCSQQHILFSRSMSFKQNPRISNKIRPQCLLSRDYFTKLSYHAHCEFSIKNYGFCSSLFFRTLYFLHTLKERINRFKDIWPIFKNYVTICAFYCLPKLTICLVLFSTLSHIP